MGVKSKADAGRPAEGGPQNKEAHGRGGIARAYVMREQAYFILRNVNQALLRAGLYLYGLCGNELKEKIDRIRDSAARPKVNAALTAFAVFMGLQLAVGFGLAGLNWQLALSWPFRFLASSSARPIAVFALLGFAGVALYVYRLKLHTVLQRGERIRELEKELEVLRAQRNAALKDAEARLAAAREALRVAIEERNRAEKRAAGAEARMRAGAQSGRAGGNDDGKFTEARRVFARLYHPDNVKSDGIEKVVRAEIFKEYWGELERIQKAGKK